MKKVAVMIAFAITLATVAVAQSSTTVKIPQGTVISVAFTHDVDSSKAHQGDIVPIEATEDVTVDGAIVVKKGASGNARVEEVSGKGGWGKNGSLHVSINYIQGVDGTNVRLRGDVNEGGGGASTGSMMMGLSGGLHKGKNPKVPQGKIVSAYVDGNQSISIPQ